MDKAPNIPVPTLTVELLERGLTKLKTDPNNPLLDQIAELSRQIHRGQMNGSFGIASDSNFMLDNQADCVVLREGGFSFLRVTGRFIRDFTNVMGLAGNVPMTDSSSFVGDSSDFIPRTFNNFGYEDPQMPAPLYDSALAMREQLELIAQLVEKSFALSTSMKIQDLFAPDLADDFVIEFPLYEKSAVVDSTTNGLPIHKHDATSETVVAVQLTSNDTGYIAGRTLEALEGFEQAKGEAVILDSQVYHGPKPQSQERLAFVVIARGEKAREVLHRGLNVSAEKLGWEPTPHSGRDLFSGASIGKAITL